MAVQLNVNGEFNFYVLVSSKIVLICGILYVFRSKKGFQFVDALEIADGNRSYAGPADKTVIDISSID